MRLAALAALIAVPALAAAPGWDGRYIFEESLGRAPSGLTPFITHTLTVTPKDCTLKTEGFQTYEHIRCRALRRGDSLVVAFDSYDDRDPDANHLKIKKYIRGAPLLILRRTSQGLFTRWQGYARRPDQGPPTGRFFRKL